MTESCVGGGSARLVHMCEFKYIISVENLLVSWREFLNGKRNKKDVQEFERNLMSNIFSLHHDLKNKTYAHGTYEAFKVNDPKPRDIHKASVRDRLLHRAIYRMLYPLFDNTFIHHSYSSRKYKGTHRALDAFRKMSRKVSRNDTRTCWVLKCDIRKFFASIDHCTLKNILATYITDDDTKRLLDIVIDSFHARPGKGLPLGNLTSQLLVNIYMNKFDQFVKHTLKAKYYIRYADDFVFLSHDRAWLGRMLDDVTDFLERELLLSLHPHKISITTLASGVDFLGWMHFPTHRVIRTVTKRHMLKRVADSEGKEEVVQSYLGLLSHGNAYALSRDVEELAEEYQDNED